MEIVDKTRYRYYIIITKYEGEIDIIKDIFNKVKHAERICYNERYNGEKKIKVVVIIKYAIGKTIASVKKELGIKENIIPLIGVGEYNKWRKVIYGMNPIKYEEKKREKGKIEEVNKQDLIKDYQNNMKAEIEKEDEYYEIYKIIQDHMFA